MATTRTWGRGFTKLYFYALNAPQSATRVNKNGLIVGASSRTPSPPPPVFIQLQGCSPPPASKKSLVFVQKHLPRRDQKPHKPCVTLVATMHSLCMAVDSAGKWLVTALPIQCCMTLAAKCCFFLFCFFSPSCVLKNAVFQPELKLAV